MTMMMMYEGMLDVQVPQNVDAPKKIWHGHVMRMLLLC